MPKKTCKNCQKPFTIYDEDRVFYNKIDMPEPTWCPDCRQQRRLVWRNERNFYPDQCDLCGKKIISVFSPNKPYRVYCPQCYWAGNWDPLAYGQDYDFSRPFFEQFKEFKLKVPHPALAAENNVNSDYVNFETDDKNCYLNVGGHYNEDCYYNTYALRSRDAVDNYWLISGELCYEVINGFHCYHCFWSLDIHDCRDCYFCYDCRGCENCFGCSGLRQQKYMLFNQKCTQEEFEEKIQEIKSYQKFLENKKKAMVVYLTVPKQFMTATKCEEVSGDYLESCKRSYHLFDGENVQDSKYIYAAAAIRDCMDANSLGFESELCYEIIAGTFDYNVHFSFYISNKSNNISYSNYCSGAKDCFGCIGIHQNQYCILNKKYKEVDYHELKGKIIEQMRKNGEYGEFFPPSISPFSYNETVAMEYFPLAKEAAIKKNFKWHDNIGGSFDKGTIKPGDVPDNIGWVSDDIIKEIFTCVNCGKNYKILVQELKFYKNQGVPLPRQCPYCRHIARINFRTSRRLYLRKCGNCGVEINTAYAPDRPEKVYCEECYRKEIY